MPKLHLTLKKSRIAVVFLLVNHLGAIVCAIISINNHFYQMVIVAFSLASLWQNLTKYAWLQNKHSVVKITLEKDRKWALKLKDETTITVILKRDSIITAHFALLNFVSVDENNKKHHFHMPICCDNIDQNEFRRLRALVKLA